MHPWVAYPLGFAIACASPFIGHWVSEALVPGGIASKARLKERVAQRKRREFIKENREQIGSYYFKTTFLLAGHVSAADGIVCQGERRKLNQRFVALKLDDEQIQVANDYFQQGQCADFNVGVALDEFVRMCGDIPALCESLLTTQCMFAEASGEVSMAEFRIIECVAKRLDLQRQFDELLAEFKLRAEVHAEEIAREKMQERLRQRDKRRSEAEKERVNKKLSPEKRNLKLAFAVLGLGENASITEIKRAYRAQIKRHHPDTLLANGYPEELLIEATKRSAEINKAYKVLKKHYHFR